LGLYLPTFPSSEKVPVLTKEGNLTAVATVPLTPALSIREREEEHALHL